MNVYDYENCPQGLSFVNNERNINYDFLFDHVGNCLCIQKHMKILEIGTGGGRNLQALHQRFSDNVELFGTDISTTALNYAASLKIGKFALSKADAIPFEEKFDLILMVDVLEHFEYSATVVNTIDNALEYLNKCGCIYISVPTELNKFSLTWFFSKLPYFRNLTKRFFGHLIQFDAKSFIKLIDINKIEIKKTFYSVHFISQLQVFLFFYIPKILIYIFLGKRLSNNLRDSNEIIKGGSWTAIRIIKIIFTSLSFPFAYLGYRESLLRIKSAFAAGNMHLLLGNKP